MKILFLCHRFPFPPEGGGQIRALYMLRHLHAAGNDVTLCSLVRSSTDVRGAAELADERLRIETAKVSNAVQSLKMLALLPTPTPASFGYFHSWALARRVDRLLRSEQWDLIVAHCSSMAPYVRNAGNIPRLLDFADMDSQKWREYGVTKKFPATIVYTLEAMKLERSERLMSERFDFCTAISPNELSTLRALAPGCTSDWFPNGVDLEYFRPHSGSHDPNLLVFIGRMNYFPNEEAVLWFCSNVWKKLRARNNRLRFRIVGAKPTRAVARLAKVPGVEVTGFVDDVRKEVIHAAVSVAPLRIARGMQNKVLESMAMGIPVVTNKRVASGLGFGADSPVRVAEDSDEYVSQIESIIADPRERSRLSQASRRAVEEDYSWQKAMTRFDSFVERCVTGR